MNIYINKKELPIDIIMIALIIALLFTVLSPGKIMLASQSLQSSSATTELVANQIPWYDFKLWMTYNDSTFRNNITSDYNCVNFSNDLTKNASAANITVYPAFVWINNNYSHQMNYGCFQDKCFLIEPQTTDFYSNVSKYVKQQQTTENWDIAGITVAIKSQTGKFIKRIY
jgi:hypothetical protein